MPDLSRICNPHHSNTTAQHQILNLLSKARDQTYILMDTSHIYFHWTTWGTPEHKTFKCSNLLHRIDKEFTQLQDFKICSPNSCLFILIWHRSKIRLPILYKRNNSPLIILFWALNMLIQEFPVAQGVKDPALLLRMWLHPWCRFNLWPESSAFHEYGKKKKKKKCRKQLKQRMLMIITRKMVALICFQSFSILFPPFALTVPVFSLSS